MFVTVVTPVKPTLAMSYTPVVMRIVILCSTAPIIG